MNNGDKGLLYIKLKSNPVLISTAHPLKLDDTEKISTTLHKDNMQIRESIPLKKERKKSEEWRERCAIEKTVS